MSIKVFESKQWNDCLLNLLANTDDEIVLRGAVIVQHMVSVNKEVAEKILETQVEWWDVCLKLCPIFTLQVMEVLQALVLKANLDAGTAEPSPVLAQVLETDQSFGRDCHPDIWNNVKPRRWRAFALQAWKRVTSTGWSGRRRRRERLLAGKRLASIIFNLVWAQIFRTEAPFHCPCFVSRVPFIRLNWNRGEEPQLLEEGKKPLNNLRSTCQPSRGFTAHWVELTRSEDHLTPVMVENASKISMLSYCIEFCIQYL